MKNMDSNAPPQTRGTPVGFARGTPVIPVKNPAGDIPRGAPGIKFHLLNKEKGIPVRDRPLFMFRDDPPVDCRQVSCHIHQNALKTMLSELAIVCRQRE